MKVLKAMKKLKFWSRKKKTKTKRTHITDPYHCCHSWHLPVQPSAPPLPPWFEYQQTHNTHSGSSFGPASGLASSSTQAEFTQQEIVPEFNSLYPVAVPVNINTSYQQYMVPNPACGLPLVPAVRREKAAGFFGCVVNIGRHLIRCFCPCFHIREVD